MWVAILNVLAAIPEFVKLIGKAVSALDSFIETEQRKAAAMEHQNALEYAKITKDTSSIEHIFRPVP